MPRTGADALFPGRALWLAIACIGCIDLVWLGASKRLSLDSASVNRTALTLGAFAAITAYCRLRPDVRLNRLATPLTGVLFIALAFTVLRVLDHLTMSVPFPYLDDALAATDSVLGLNWLAYAGWVANRPMVLATFETVYSALGCTALVVFIVLFASGRIERAREFVRVVFATSLTTTIAGMFCPALGAMHRLATPALRNVFGPQTGVGFVPYLEMLRAQTPHVLQLDSLPGLVGIPSLHTAFALLIVYSCRGIPILRTGSILYAVPMIASTPIIGGHYFVDLIAGGLLVAVMAPIDRYFRPPVTAALHHNDNAWAEDTDSTGETADV